MVIKSTEQSPSGLNIYLNHPWNLLKTGFLVLTWITVGFYLEIVGPTVSILAANTGTNYSGMGSALASISMGYLVGSILGIILPDLVKKHSEGLLVCAFILPAIAIFAIPYVTSLILMCVLFFVEGFAESFTDLCGTNLLLTMWGVNAAIPLNVVYSGYGIGAVLVNLLVLSFLHKKSLSFRVTDNEGVNSTSSSINAIWANSNIVIPYSITAILCVLIAAGHAFFYFRELRNQKQALQVPQAIDYGTLQTNSENVTQLIDKNTSSPYSPRTFGHGDFQYGLILSCIFICYLFFVCGTTQTFSRFFFTYIKFEQLNLSNGVASSGIILSWTFGSISRIIAAIGCIYISAKVFLNILFFGGLCLVIVWLIFVWSNGLTGTSLLILGAGIGLVFGPIFPLSCGLMNQRLNVTPVLLASVLCGTALGAATFQKTAGFIMDHNSNYFPVLIFISISMSFILYVASNIVYFLHERKKSLNTQPSVVIGAPLSLESFNEEEKQMANQLRDQEDK